MGQPRVGVGLIRVRVKRRLSTVPEALGGLEGRSATVGPHRLWVRACSPRSATGPPVVLAHGIVSSRYLLPTASVLARRHRTVAVDLPGFGRSSRPAQALSVTELADALMAAMADVGAEMPVVVGHSFGAQVAVELAVLHPGLISGVVLVGPTGDPRVRSITRLWGRWAATAPSEPLAFNALVLRELADVGPLRMLTTAHSFVSDPFEAKLERVGVPSLVVRGDRDRVAPMDWADQVSARLGGVPLEVIPGAAHTVVYSVPQQLAALVSGFVEGVGAISGSPHCGGDHARTTPRRPLCPQCRPDTRAWRRPCSIDAPRT